MDQEAQDAKLIVHLSDAFSKDEVWQLAAAEAWSKATSLERVLIRDSTAAKQLKLVDVLINKASAAGLGAGNAAGAEGAGGAGGAGPGAKGGGGAGALPAPRRLMDGAAELQPHLSDANSIVWKLTYSDRVMSYVDATGEVVDRIRSWAKAALRDAVNLHRENAPAPLLVSGLVKTGKSYTQEHVVPAVVAEALRRQQQAKPQAEDVGGEAPLAGMVVLRLRCDELYSLGGATAMLKSLLEVLVEWARKEHVPLQAGALAAAEAKLVRPHDGLPSGPGAAIQAFLKAVEVPVLVLCDEVQSLLLPTIDGKLDVAGAGYVRDKFMKTMLVYGSHTVLWCLTGSSMALTWISLANMPPNGYALIVDACAVHLPATCSAAHLAWAWQWLQKDADADVELHSLLLELSPPSVALLTVLVRSWVSNGRPSDVAAFVREFMQFKLVEESRKEWKVGLEAAMPLSQRLAILDLSFPAVGVRIDTELHPGLRRFLVPHLDKTDDGRHFLRDAHQRQIVRLLFNKDGTLRNSWSALEFSATLTQLDCGWDLLYLGEAADYLLGLKASDRWQREEPPAGKDTFEAKLQAMAKDVGNKLEAAAKAAAEGEQQQQQQQQQQVAGAALSPQELWERQPWFQKVLNSEWNDRDREAYLKNKQARSTHLAMLVFYLRLSRNVLAHTKPWDMEAGAMLDVGVMIEALPGVLGQSLFDFNEVMVQALRLLSRRTVEAAAAAVAAEVTGGEGDGIEGSAEDASSSSDSRLSSGTVGSSAGGLGSGTGESSGGRLSSGTGGSSGGRLGSGLGQSNVDGLSSSTGGSSSTSGAGRINRGGGRGSSSSSTSTSTSSSSSGGGGGGRGRGRGARPMADQCAPDLSRPGPAAAGCGQRLPLVYTSSGRGGWGIPRAPTLAPRLQVRLLLLTPAAAAATPLGPRLPCW